MKPLFAFIWLLHSNLIFTSTLNTDTPNDDFKSLVLNNDVFVDKTLMIEEFVQMFPESFVPLIIRPRGWGKSTNMDMLRKFYEIEVDDQGKRLPENRTVNDKLFLGGEIRLDENSPPKKLNPLKISHLSSVLQYMGQMPVILVKFENVTGKCYEEIEQSIKSRIVQAFQSHRYLFSYNFTSQALFGAENVRKYFTADFNTTELKRSLFTLSGTLYTYFHLRRVVILVDDYDIPLINSYLEFGHKQEEYEKVVDLLDSMYEIALKNSIFLHKALVTGILRMSFNTLANPIPRLDNLEICTFFYRRFCHYYGFTREEVKDLLERLPSTTVNVEQLNSWYGGYDIDEHTYLNGDLVMKCISNNSSMGYYEQSGIAAGALIDKIFATDKMQPKIQNLISGQKLNFDNFLHLMQIRWNVLPELAVLYHFGYLNKTNSLTNPQVAIPNKQIQHIYEMKSLQWVATKFGSNTSHFFLFANCLYNGSMDQFRETLPKFLSNAARLIQAGEKQSTAVYNAMRIALQTALSSSHEKTNDGLADGFILIPKLNRGDKAIIFKYKTTIKQEDVISEAKSSIEQIDSYLNCTSLKRFSHIQTIHKIGLGLCGINVAVEDQITTFFPFTTVQPFQLST